MDWQKMRQLPGLKCESWRCPQRNRAGVVGKSMKPPQQARLLKAALKLLHWQAGGAEQTDNQPCQTPMINIVLLTRLCSLSKEAWGEVMMFNDMHPDLQLSVHLPSVIDLLDSNLACARGGPPAHHDVSLQQAPDFCTFHFQRSLIMCSLVQQGN